jgi:hypothetical protein
MSRKRQVSLRRAPATAANAQPYDPAGARTQDLRIKRWLVDSGSCSEITAYDGACETPCTSIVGDTSDTSARPVSLRCHPKPLQIGFANLRVWGR